MDKERLIRKFNKQAKIYERRRKKKSEKEWREKLIQCARGNILEVGVGAGANFNFYSKDVHVTAVDFSEEMLDRARQAAFESHIQTDFKRLDIETLSFPDNSFDTIVSTLTLCGYDDPTLVLKKFNSWCKSDGQILLMEHGVSSNQLIGHIHLS
jgi:ubiquinone/menaquinone biosynthesis C-methylase UbiE